MPQLDFNVLLNNFLILLVFFIFFYLFLSFFFLRRLFSVILYRAYSLDTSQKRQSYLYKVKLEVENSFHYNLTYLVLTIRQINNV